ncbi:phage protein [Burkholderia pyrrocinia]|uniref:phage protein n=1 Tax=Burkholderia pyrrocinia TaxID=60550 RepID=UPI0038B58C9D
MSVQQFGRKVSLIIGFDSGDALDMSELRIVFRVQRGDLQTPNSARIRVYNLSATTARRAQKEFTRVVLQAGYEGNYGIIFDGQIKQVRRGRESQTDTFLDITAADGDSAYNFAVVNSTLAAGSVATDHVSVATAAMNPYGVSLGYMPQVTSNPLPRGKVMFGMARDFLRGIAKTTQTVWSIQDGKVVLVPETAYMPGEIPVITSDTGMVGLPQQTANGIEVKMLLNPSVKIGRLIWLDNASIQRYEYSLNVGQQAENERIEMQAKLQDDGFYYVMLAEVSGDTRGEEWYTSVTCLAADVTVLPDSFKDKAAVPSADVIKRYG